MLIINQNGTTTITVTWYQRAGSGDRYQLVIQHLSTNTTSTFTILKSSNQSQYRNRFDRFIINAGSLPTGQFRYTVYDTNSTYQNAGQIVETGIGIVPQQATTITAYQQTQTYAVYNGAGIFDPTFDNSFN
jgi:hypothetical protein